MTDWTKARELCERATRSPWYARGRHISLVPDNSGMGATLHTNHVAVCAEKDDAEFIAAARTLLPAALDEIERLTKALHESDLNRKSAEGKLDIMLTENTRVQAEFTAACREWIAERNASANRIARLEAIAREAIDIATMSLSHLGRNAETKAARLAALLEEVNGNG